MKSVDMRAVRVRLKRGGDGRGRLSGGVLVQVGRISDLFEVTPAGYASQSPQEHLFGWSNDLARSVRYWIESAPTDSIVIFDLSGLVKGNPLELMEGLKAGISTARPRGGPARHRPRRTAGRRYPVIRWVTRRFQGSSQDFRKALIAEWWRDDWRPKSDRVPTILLTERGPTVLGRIPEFLSGARLDAVLDRRWLTYRILGPDPTLPGHSAKALGRAMREYGDMGLLIPRGYASAAELAQLGYDDVGGTARPLVWESVAASALELFPVMARMRHRDADSEAQEGVNS